MFQWAGQHTLGFLALCGCLTSIAAAIYLRRLKRKTIAKRSCPRCRYDMQGIASLTCRECGNAATHEPALHRRRHSRWWLVVCTLAFLGSASAWVVPECRSGRWVRWVPTDALIVLLPWWNEHDPANRLKFWTLRLEFNDRCEKSTLTDSQWERLCERIVGLAESQFASGKLNEPFQHMNLLAWAQHHGKLQRAFRDRMDALVQISIGPTTVPVESYPVYPLYFPGYCAPLCGWPVGEVRVEHFDLETKAPVATGPFSASTKCQMDAAPRFSTSRQPIAIVQDHHRPVCVLQRITEITEDPRTGRRSVRTVAEGAVEIPGPILSREELSITPRTSIAVEQAIRGTKASINLEYRRGGEDGIHVCFSIDRLDLTTILRAEGINLLTVRYEVLYEGIAIGFTQQWPDQPGVLHGLYGVNVDPSHLPPNFEWSKFQLRVIGDVALALQHPNVKNCWVGEVVLSSQR
ncbi:MAG: hypothetical protein ACKVZJ_11725 [Phycisphaerales bacterium]